MSSSLTPVAIDFGKVAAVFGSKDGPLLDLLLSQHREEFEQVDELADELEDEDEDDEDGDEGDRRASLLALSQLLGKAKQGLEGGIPPGKALSGLGQSTGVSQQHQRALKDLLSDSGDDACDDAESPPSDHASAADVMRHLITGEKPAKRAAFKFMYGYALQYLCQHLGEELRHELWQDLRGSSWTKSLDKALKSVGIPAKTLSVAKHLAGRGSPFKQIPKYNDNPTIGYLTVPEVGRAFAALQDASLDTLDEEMRAMLEDLRGWLKTCADTQRDLICFSN